MNWICNPTNEEIKFESKGDAASSLPNTVSTEQPPCSMHSTPLFEDVVLGGPRTNSKALAKAKQSKSDL